MYEILTLNKIAKCGLDLLDPAKYNISDDAKNPDGVILRSYNMHDMELPASLKAIARAGAGVNNIPIDKCSEAGIVVFNTPGANANAVKELTITGLLLASRKIVDGINWAKTLKDEADAAKLVEKGKSNFVGPEIEGKRLGVIGLGAIGVMVANVAYSLGMEVVGYDPYISVDAAWGMSRHVKKATDLKQLVETCDYITLHLPLNDSTKGMINKEVFDMMPKGTRLLNFSRAALVDNAALKDAIADGTIACYVTDFPDAETLSMDGVICLPHLGASTPESEDNCAKMAANEIDRYLAEGVIVNSVNYPNCDLPLEEGKARVTIAHRNVPNMLSSFSNVFAGDDINISNMLNKSKKDYAYTIIDADMDIIPDDITEKLAAIEGVLRVRVI
ncbi:MAG: 3-phosphoglycerate dehydrogenase [Ruminococcaceae bacterium]|nr:3-phosphoglycerate dehydrogenase [Oscillospiraceae bacterium]